MVEWFAQTWIGMHQHIQGMHPFHAGVALVFSLLWLNLVGCWFASIVQDYRGKNWNADTLKLWAITPITAYMPVAVLVLYACGFIES